MKKFLLIGDLRSIHIFNLTKNILCQTDYEITAYHTGGNKESIPNKYLEIYEKANIQVVPGHDLIKIGPLKYISCVYTDLKSLGKFDILNIQYISHYIAPIIHLLRHNYKKIVLAFWGSDLFRSTRIKRLMTLPLIKDASTIQLMTDYMQQQFAVTVGYKKYINKTTVLDFGDFFLDGIDSFRQESLDNRSKIKQEFGLDCELPVVVIGYVGRPEMQQLKALNSILEDSSINKLNFQIALPIFGMQSGEVSNLKTILDNSGIAYKLYPDFMDEAKVVKFRSISDVFIHPQTTDALSCSVVECFYTGCVVINGAWLRYDNLDNAGAYYHKFDSFSKLAPILKNVLSNINIEKEKSKVNVNVVKGMFHWDVLRPQWLKMYTMES